MKYSVLMAAVMVAIMLLYTPDDNVWRPAGWEPVGFRGTRLFCAVARTDWCTAASRFYPEFRERLPANNDRFILEPSRDFSKAFCPWVIALAEDGDVKAQWAYAEGYSAQGGSNSCGAPRGDLVTMLDTPAGRRYRPSRISLAFLYSDTRIRAPDAVTKGDALFSDDDDDAALYFRAAALEKGIGRSADSSKARDLYQRLLSRLPKDVAAMAPDSPKDGSAVRDWLAARAREIGSFKEPDRFYDGVLVRAAHDAIGRINRSNSVVLFGNSATKGSPARVFSAGPRQ